MAFLRSKLYKLRISLGVEQKIWNSLEVELIFSRNYSGAHPYSSGAKPYLMAVFRGECNFIQSSGTRRKGKSSTGAGTKIKCTSPITV